MAARSDDIKALEDRVRRLELAFVAFIFGSGLVPEVLRFLK